MENPMRTLILALFAVLAAPFAALATEAPAETRVVVDLTTGDAGRFEARLVEALPKLRAHYAEQQRPLNAVVVVHGDAYKFFLKDGPLSPDRAAALAALAKDVRFEVCLVGMARKGLKMEQFVPWVHGAKSASIALIDYQHAGHALVTVD
jgi:intracellular sulfur oxidation DsrE/DsrF family protein